MKKLNYWVNGVYRKDSEIYMKVELKFLAYNISLTERKWDESVPGNEKVLSLAQIKSLKRVSYAIEIGIVRTLIM